MAQRGRKSAAALAVVESNGLGISRIGPPSTLTAGERAIWAATVNSKPADWFGSEHVPILIDYCRHVVRAEIIDEQIKAFKPEWLAEDDGLRRYERLLAMGVKESGMCNALARSMRVTHQSIYVAAKAGTAMKHARPWQLDGEDGQAEDN